MLCITHFCRRKQLQIFDLFFFPDGVMCLPRVLPMCYLREFLCYG